jgi:transcriptional regulator with XRE-family HTH domain
MKERILEFLRYENKSSAQFAEEIGVQPSGISHILSGRNNPSLDFVMKMLDKYSDLSVDWLLFGKGKMYKTPPMHSLFDENMAGSGDISSGFQDRNHSTHISEQRESKTEKQLSVFSGREGEKGPSVVKIVWFYEDKSFIEYYPFQEGGG